ncbi:MAG: hypothetical protein FWD15_04570 [Alphaproteobacteria bacterium]|nr:hypothetical protein [Alphaproteobacteria bacterium]
MADKKDKAKINPVKVIKRTVIWAEMALLISLFFVGPPFIALVLALMAGLLFFYFVMSLC